ncbi:MAG: hypothetical protein BGO87_13805 [Flavobacteriia bacterium 40-80]|nr:MAG: hypothetical protein BGO87_13805 [Flavobacteriia bacterium 40-80]
MNEDEQILLFSYLLFWTTFAFLLIKNKYNKQILIINLTIHVIYSSYFLHCLFYRSYGNGTALAWWFYLLLLLWTHCIINLGQLIHLIIKAKKQKIN